jgi:hypothetical protein
LEVGGVDDVTGTGGKDAVLLAGARGGRKKHHSRRSGKEVALLPLPPLRTGRESFPSSGSSRSKAPYYGAGELDGFNPASRR